MPKEKVTKETLKQSEQTEEYATLKDDFSQIIRRGISSFQEKTPGREIKFATMRLQGRYGFIVQTNARGLLEVTEMSGTEIDNQGNFRKQRMFMGMNCSVTTKKSVFASVNMLRSNDTIIKEFEANAGAYELLKFSTARAQKKGEDVQRRITEESYEHWDRYIPPAGHEASANWDVEKSPSMDKVFELVMLARQSLKTELGAKLADCKIVFFHIVDTTELADSIGSRIDSAIPRTGISIQVTTDAGNEVYDCIRGVGGMSVITRNCKGKSPEEAVKTLAASLAKQCKDVDRAQPCSVLDGEAHVVLSGLLSGVFAHEALGHVVETDLIIENKHNSDVDLNLKARLGGQVSENSAFNVVDDGHFKVPLGNKEVSHCFGAMLVDDEGTPAKRTQLVTNGIQTLVLNSADTFNEVTAGLADHIKQNLEDHGLSGNLRSESFDKKPMIRMTNTFVVPNEDGPKSAAELAAMIPKSKKGVYIATCLGGWVELDNGNFELTGQLGYLIENGIITDKPVKDVIVHGNITKFGSKIKAIGSSDTLETSSGFCLKGSQAVCVEDGGPAILVEDVCVGKKRPSWFWKDAFKEYSRQMREVAAGQRKRSEVHLRFMDQITEDDSRQHSRVCMLAKKIPLEEEVSLLLGRCVDTADYILGVNGELEEK